MWLPISVVGHDFFFLMLQLVSLPLSRWVFHDHVLNTCAYSIQSYVLSIYPENNSVVDFMTNKRMYI